MHFKLASLLLFWHLNSQAEYRAFNLKITDTSNNLERYVESNLDPIQYQGYNPLKPTEIITYTDSWMCPGRTSDFLKICVNPSSNRIPASDKTSLTPESPTTP